MLFDKTKPDNGICSSSDQPEQVTGETTVFQESNLQRSLAQRHLVRESTMPPPNLTIVHLSEAE